MKPFFFAATLLVFVAVRAQTFAIHFPLDSYELTSKARQELDSFFSAEHEKLVNGRIELSGHCDFRGSEDYNDTLSFRRAMKVKKYLESNFAGSHMVVLKAYGERAPLNSNRTEEERRLNRRVEIRIVGAEEPEKTATNVQDRNIPLKQKLSDSTLKEGTKIVLKNINFFGGRHAFLPEAYPALQELLETMLQYPGLVIQIQGHICCQPTDGDALDGDTREYNLSEQRAKAVYDYLIANNIEAKRLSYAGYGHSMPIHPYPEQSEEERIENRRVEIKIISK